MSSKQMVVSVAALALLLSVGLVLPAADEDHLPSGTTVDFTVPSGTTVQTGNGTDIVIFNRDDGVVDPGNCGEFGTLHAAVAVHPDSRGNYRAELIEATVTYPSVVPPGTRLGSLQALGSCTGGGGIVQNKYRGVVE